MYHVIDIRTHEAVAKYKLRQTAQKKAEKLNQEYGAHRWSVVFVEGV